MVTSWPPRWCGIAIYSENLVEALRAAGAEVHVVCHNDGGRPGEPQVHPAIDQADPGWPHALLRAVDAIKPDVVHVQHEFGLYALFDRPGVYSFEPRRAFELATALFRWRAGGLPAVVTYHSVFSRLTREENLYYGHTMRLAAANVVHEPYQRVHLADNLGQRLDNVFVCPHGAGLPARDRPARRRLARARLGLPAPGEAPVCGLMGWWEPNKGFDRLVALWPAVRRLAPGALLVLAGDARPGSPAGPATRDRYLDLVTRSPVRDAIRVVQGRFTREEYMEVLHACDCLVLPYLYASQSGNLAHAYQAGLPVVVTALEGLKSSVEASGAGLVVPRDDDAELVRAVATLLTDGALRRRLALRSARYARRVVAWDRVARRHLAIYAEAARLLRREAGDRRFLDHRVHV